MFQISLAVFKKNRSTVLHAYPWSFIISRITGGIFAILFPMLMFYFVFNQQVSDKFVEYIGTNNYVSYIVLGQALDVLAFATLMNVGRCLITEIREGTLDTFLLSPASRMQYYIGAYVEQLGRSSLEYGIILLFGLFVGFKIEISKIIWYVIIFFIASVSFFSLSILLSTVMVYTRDTYLVQNTLMIFMECVCGVVFPIQYLPKSLQVISNLFPLTPMLNIFRACVLSDQRLGDCWKWLIQVGILSMVYIIVGYFGFRKMEKKLIEDVLA